MSLYVAFLRGMNVANRRVTNRELCAWFEAVGFEGVSAVLASGNVVFESRRRSTARLERQIEQGLSGPLGYEVPTFVRSAADVTEIAVKRPFSNASVALSAGNLQVALLSTRPTRSDCESGLARATPDDLLAIDGREMYWLPKVDIAESKLDLNALGRILGLMTIRTQRTMARVATNVS